jgi:ribose transport system permease protein
MRKLLGMAVFLAVLYVVLLSADENARSAQNHYNLAKRIGLQGILSLGVGMLIITGGIDLSIGAVVGLSATLMAVLLVDFGWHPYSAIAAVLGMGVAIGMLNGVLVTKLKLQAFVVTLCGLFIYRGIARWMTNDGVRGLSNQVSDLRRLGLPQDQIDQLVRETSNLKDLCYRDDVFPNLLKPWDIDLGFPKFLVIFLILAVVATVFLHFSVYGRYFFAIGSNERAARYSGIATDRYKILAYILCSFAAALAGILFLMENNSAQPSSTGTFYELYAIAGAVLGGCSLRGGEGNVLGIIIGTTILWILPTLTKMWGISSNLEPVVIGVALLLGATMDELLRPRGEKRLAG